MVAKEYVRTVPGSHTAVLLIHGIVGTPDQFRDLIPRIPEEWSVCNLLLDGHGKGVREFGASSMAKWKGQVSARLEDLLQSHSRVLIAGHSMGTLLAVRAAMAHPQEVSGLFLMNMPLRVHLPPATLLASLKNTLGMVKEGDNPAWAMKEGCGVQLSPRLWQYLPWLARFAELLREVGRIRKLLPQLPVPALAFHAQKDELVSNRTLRDLEGQPHITTVVLPKSGHFQYGQKDLARLRKEWEDLIARMGR